LEPNAFRPSQLPSFARFRKPRTAKLQNGLTCRIAQRPQAVGALGFGVGSDEIGLPDADQFDPMTAEIGGSAILDHQIAGKPVQPLDGESYVPRLREVPSSVRRMPPDPGFIVLDTPSSREV